MGGKRQLKNYSLKKGGNIHEDVSAYITNVYNNNKNAADQILHNNKGNKDTFKRQLDFDLSRYDERIRGAVLDHYNKSDMVNIGDKIVNFFGHTAKGITGIFNQKQPQQQNPYKNPYSSFDTKEDEYPSSLRRDRDDIPEGFVSGSQFRDIDSPLYDDDHTRPGYGITLGEVTTGEKYSEGRPVFQKPREYSSSSSSSSSGYWSRPSRPRYPNASDYPKGSHHGVYTRSQLRDFRKKW